MTWLAAGRLTEAVRMQGNMGGGARVRVLIDMHGRLRFGEARKHETHGSSQATCDRPCLNTPYLSACSVTSFSSDDDARSWA